MSIHRYSLAAGDLPIDCPEKRFILGYLLQTIQDAQAYGKASSDERKSEDYIESTDIHAQWLASGRFRWWCELLGISADSAGWQIMLIMRGCSKLDKRIKVGIQRGDEEVTEKRLQQVRSIASLGGVAKAKAKVGRNGEGTEEKEVPGEARQEVATTAKAACRRAETTEAQGVERAGKRDRRLSTQSA